MDKKTICKYSRKREKLDKKSHLKTRPQEGKIGLEEPSENTPTRGGNWIKRTIGKHARELKRYVSDKSQGLNETGKEKRH